MVDNLRAIHLSGGVSWWVKLIRSKVSVAKTRARFGNPEEYEHRELKAATKQRLVETNRLRKLVSAR
jgi:hypothetical protein